ncbi:hypothetical protein VP01_3654g2 [Puccinia sorghi]|uniref:Uncharacterized protein n=1 Tax=Puccinia sorghi TaxID=27349 RepID=A0A0L6UUH4_9BASI|nr:hypothetical protein VP01_3654g2 [Puccinia sorghi]
MSSNDGRRGVPQLSLVVTHTCSNNATEPSRQAIHHTTAMTFIALRARLWLGPNDRSGGGTRAQNDGPRARNQAENPLLVSATTPGSGKKEALINKLGFQATQRAIRRTNSQRKLHPRLDRSSNHPSCSSASSQPSSPQTWRTATVGKWLESADEEDEDEAQHQ